MYPHQHAAVSVGATFAVAWAGGVGPIQIAGLLPLIQLLAKP